MAGGCREDQKTPNWGYDEANSGTEICPTCIKAQMSLNYLLLKHPLLRNQFLKITSLKQMPTLS